MKVFCILSISRRLRYIEDAGVKETEREEMFGLEREKTLYLDRLLLHINVQYNTNGSHT